MGYFVMSRGNSIAIKGGHESFKMKLSHKEYCECGKEVMNGSCFCGQCFKRRLIENAKILALKGVDAKKRPYTSDQ